DEDGARPAFPAIAPELGAREPKLVANRHREGFLLHHVDAALLAVDVQRDEAVDGAWRRRLPEQRRRAEQVGGGGGDGPRGDHAFDEAAPRHRLGRFFRHLFIIHCRITSSGQERPAGEGLSPAHNNPVRASGSMIFRLIWKDFADVYECHGGPCPLPWSWRAALRPQSGL